MQTHRAVTTMNALRLQLRSLSLSEKEINKYPVHLLPGEWRDGDTKTRVAPKLLILDLNGLLVHRLFKFRATPEELAEFPEPSGEAGSFHVWERKHAREFLKFCMDNFAVGIWSSAQFKNVKGLLMYLLPDANDRKLLAMTWDQKKCTDTGEKDADNPHKPIFLKELANVWADPLLGRIYNESNTVLIDDSLYKVRNNPPNTSIHPSVWTPKASNDAILGEYGSLRSYLAKLKLADSVPEFIKSNPYSDTECTETE